MKTIHWPTLIWCSIKVLAAFVGVLLAAIFMGFLLNATAWFKYVVLALAALGGAILFVGFVSDCYEKNVQRRAK